MMCGRYSLITPVKAVRALFKFEGATPNFAPRYNIAPTQAAPVIIQKKNGERELVVMRWGLVPAWSKGPDNRYSMFNARAETVHEKRAYRFAFEKRRCLVPVDGFYEWRRSSGIKIPYRISLIDECLFAFAGLWEHWEGSDGSFIDSFTIITTRANSLISRIHDRMPVIIPLKVHTEWLSRCGAAELLIPYSTEKMKAHPVDAYVNDVRHDEPMCIWPPGESLPDERIN